MRGAAIERELLDATMRDRVDGAAGRLVHAARFHADEAVFDEVEAADPVLAAELVERGEQRGGAHRLAIERHPVAGCKTDLDGLGCVGCILRADGAREHVIGHLLPRILEHLALGGGVQDVGVGGKGAVAALVLGDLDLVLLGPVDERGAAGQVPFAPWAMTLMSGSSA